MTGGRGKIVRDDVRERVGAVRCHHKIVLRTAEQLVRCVDYAHLGESGAQTLDEMAEAVHVVASVLDHAHGAILFVGDRIDGGLPEQRGEVVLADQVAV